MKILMLRKITIFFLFLLMVCKAGMAQGQLSQIVFEPMSISDEFLSKSVHRIFQDKEGYIWLGTEDRVYRYDGFKLRQYSTNIESTGTLADNEVQAFAENNTSIWIGTQRGIRIINKRNYDIADFDYAPLKNVRINYLMTDSQNNMWIGAQNGLYRYNAITKLVDEYKYIYGDNNSIPGNGINYIYEDQDKNIWIAAWDCGLCRYVPSRNNFDRYPGIGVRNNPFRVFQDKEKNYWIATWGNGLFRFYPNAQGPESYKPFDIKRNDSNKKEEIFYSIVQDDKYGYLWLVSYTAIFAITDIEKHEYADMSSSSSLQGSNNLFNEITKDKNGNLWIGTYGNIVYTVNMDRPNVVNYNLKKNKKKFEITPSVNAIYEDNDGIAWLSLKRMGIQLYDRNKDTFLQSVFDQRVIDEFNTQEDVNIIREIRSKDEIWITFNSNYKIAVLKRQGNKVVLSRIIDLDVDVTKYPFSENTVTGILEDKNGKIWVASKAGLYFLDSQYRISKVENSRLNQITSISLDKNNELWIATSQYGLMHLDNDKNLILYNTGNKKLERDNIQSIYCQQSGVIWAGSKDGKIYVLDQKSDRFITFVNKINSKEEPILDISDDAAGHIWLSTNKRIFEIDPVTMTSRTYSQPDGLEINPFNKGAYFKSPAGYVFFGGNNGFCYLPSSDFGGRSNKANRVFITNIMMQEKSIFDTKYISNLDLQNMTLTLEPWQNNIEIDFSSFNYFSSNKIEFAYKIDGIDDNWNYISGNRYFAMYNSLPKGKYTFWVKARNEYGVWDDNCAQLHIYKKPYYYETWWAYLIYSIIIIGIVYAIYRNTINRWKLKNELRIAQIEKDSSEQLAQTKLRYFTNVSHELMTPLTIISCLVEDVQKSSDHNIWQYQSIISNVNRLKRLLQQILDFRKVESGNMTLKIQWGDIVSFTKNICKNNFAPLFKDKNINFTFSSQEEKIELYYDSDKIDKILYNLLSNAIKYTPEGGQINVQIDITEHGTEHFVRLIVNDNGKGIKPEELPHIFNRFFHSDKAKKEYSNGIGLSLSKELIELHHGSISVESQVNAGTIFIIEIPMDANSYSENEFCSDMPSQNKEIIVSEMENDALATVADSSSNHSITMLIVEDNHELRFILNKILARDYKTVVAGNGVEALHIVEETDIDVIISDVSMPEMDGLTLCRTIKNNINTSHIPVLLITAHNSIESRVECYNAGADGYLSKPFEQQILDAKIKSLLRNRKKKQEIFRNDIDSDVSAFKYPSIEEEFLNQTIDIIKNEYLSYNDLDPDMLASKLNISRSTLYRKIKSLTDLSPSDFIRIIRLKQACLMLRDPQISIKEVAFAVGFVDQRYFSACFKNEFGVTPTEFQKTGNKKNAKE